MAEDVYVAGARRRFIEPRATDHMPQMHRLIVGLVAGGHA
ncbi:hypothetical protein LKMONMHP_4730 [Methylobacterium organophilum]|uniref:Uncharacterized protein n=1 Tax=Methylobacterium organophilum TaxID=410 RepID=A0ABQ4TE20_METOR|nr:hypothetical protein LKMONMHP_4730 [Methylobacterium organophilum]